MDSTPTAAGPPAPSPDLPTRLREFKDDPDVARLLRLERVGACRLKRLLGEGGMGMVFLAEQEEPIRRTVAVKIIRLGLDTREVLARFRAERQALALMDHPAIAKVHEAGSTEDGRPYFVMEYVPGEPITAYCDRRRLDLPARLELFREVCRGVQHAHQKGILHRDLKPSNILVAEVDDRPRPKIIDFGVAKSLGPELGSGTLVTRSGEFLGTPEYASPEQAAGGDLDTRADIYALGALLYELLVGVVPLAWEERRPEMLGRFLDRVQNEEPLRPSRRAASLGGAWAEPAASRRLLPGSLVRRLRGDLDWIVLRALEKDRGRRYGTAAELEADLGRHLRCEPVLAKAPSSTYLFWKAIRRHRGKVAASAAVLVALLAGLIASTFLYLEAAARYQEVLCLSDRELLTRLCGEAEARHWPFYAWDEVQRRVGLTFLPEECMAKMGAWIVEAEGLRGRLPRHRRILARMRSAAEERPLDPRDHPDLSKLATLNIRHETLDEAGRPDLEKDLAAGQAAIRDLEQKIREETARGRSWRHPDPREDWRLQEEDQLVRALEALSLEDPRKSCLAEMRRRLAAARNLVDATLTSDVAVARWAEAAQAIAANPRYAGLQLSPQLGLLPLGEDPASGLWEFWHVLSGDRPARAAAGPSRWRLTAETGIVLVLLPGGTSRMGARRPPPGQAPGPHEDPQARPDEQPVHDVRLAPFFLSKYEVTQGQWERCCRLWFREHRLDQNRSFFQATAKVPGSYDWPVHPAEQILPSEALEALRRLGLTLPTEAQWEYACRAGTATPWCSNDGRGGIFENLADRSLVAQAGAGRVNAVEWDDRFPFTAPVGSFPPNPFGLHDMLGNVSEACLDLYNSYREPPVDGTGGRSPLPATSVQIRGGNYRSDLELARSAARNAEVVQGSHIGARAARGVEGPSQHR